MVSLVIRAISRVGIPRIPNHNITLNSFGKINSKVQTQTFRSFGNSTVFMSNRKFSEKHEWVSVEGKIGTIGITNYAQESLGDIVYAQLPDIGVDFSQNDECGALESVKAASEIYSPVSGKVTEVNTELEDQPSLINQSCYEKGWLFKLELSKEGELSELMDEEGYEKFLKDQ